MVVKPGAGPLQSLPIAIDTATLPHCLLQLTLLAAISQPGPQLQEFTWRHFNAVSAVGRKDLLSEKSLTPECPLVTTVMVNF